ncbi:MAG: hypothetical protein WC635_08985 [Bacteriovorax sp.]|jgi:hypothetical protein
MENKKQLVIVPPMSEPLQKLSEVLRGVVDEENIDISFIDDPKELAQFSGSAGQCLIVFSNPKKCATFLQENRFVLAKNHSKVILFTPKEIPAKTLIKFVKIGLTESILENSAPKTLLYKVKLLLRSIKTSSPQQTDKDQIVKSKTEAAQTAENKTEISIEKEAAAEDSLNYLTNDKGKNKKFKDENAEDYSDGLKGKNNYQEESIDTNWKSKRNTDIEASSEEEASTPKVEGDQSDIDMYYRGKRKKNLIEVAEEEEKRSKKMVAEDELVGTSKRKDLDEDLEPESSEKKKKKSNYVEEEEGTLAVKRKLDSLEIVDSTSEAKKEIPLSAEEKADLKRKELDEMDALIEAARKNQSMPAEDLGGHLKGKISLTDLTENEEPEIKEKKEYDNSELHKKEKQFDLDLLPGEVEARRKYEDQNSEDEKAPHDGVVDNIESNMASDKGSTDKISTLMIGEIGKEKNKNISENEIHELPKKKNLDIEEAFEESSKKSEIDQLEDASRESKGGSLNLDDIQEGKKKDKLDSEIVEPTKKALNKATQDEDDSPEETGAKAQGLSLVEDDDEHTASAADSLDAHMNFKKLDQSDDKSGDKKDKTHNGQVDKIDTYYRGGEAKKKDHSWDNLTGKTQTESHEITKTRKADENGHSLLKPDLGEQTIDYRQIKEEFEAMAGNGTSANGSTASSEQGHGLSDSEDEGSFKVVELDSRGFEFGIEVINLIYQKDSKPQDFYKKVSEELISEYKAYPVFFTFRPGDKKHTEVFDSFMYFGDSLVSLELKEWWINAKTEQVVFNDYFEKTMTTWLCRSIPSKSGNAPYWEDVELPSWAANELTDKKVEMIFPYFDGVDRMGVAVIIFPLGVVALKEKSIMTTLELARTVMLDSIQRKAVLSSDKSSDEEAPPAEKKNILSIFSGLFNRKKAG